MDWLQVQIELGELPPAPVEAALLALGAVSVTYRDGADEAILEPAPGAMPLWRKLSLGALLDPATAPEAVQAAVAAAVAPAPTPAMRFVSLADRDWVREFRQSLKAQQFGNRLWILPRGAPPAPADAPSLRLEPGLAFGSGNHPTTALCLEWLAEIRCTGHLLDYGCGSGILALAALRLGAAAATAVDIDPQARQACADNAADNGLARDLGILAPEELPPGLRFDALVANILSGPLITLAPQLCAILHAGAPVALSGILPSQADDVRHSYSPWVAFSPPRVRDEWVLLAGHVRAEPRAV